MEYFLCPTFLEYPANVESALVVNSEKWDYPYTLLSHTEDILKGHGSEEYLADIVMKLNRLVDARLDQLEETYAFSRLRGPERNLGRIEKIHECGLIRKRVLAEINALRNGIEHRRQLAPNKEKVETFIEFCWYFLRLTDSLLRHQSDAVCWTDGAERLWVTVTFDFEDYWRATAHGWVADDMLSTKSIRDWWSLEITDIETRVQSLERIPGFRAEEEKKRRQCCTSGQTRY